MANSALITKCCSNKHGFCCHRDPCISALRQPLVVKQPGHQPRAWPCCSAAGRPQQGHRTDTHLCCQLAIAPGASPPLACRAAQPPVVCFACKGSAQTKMQLQSKSKSHQQPTAAAALHAPLIMYSVESTTPFHCTVGPSKATPAVTIAALAQPCACGSLEASTWCVSHAAHTTPLPQVSP